MSTFWDLARSAATGAEASSSRSAQNNSRTSMLRLVTGRALEGRQKRSRPSCSALNALHTRPRTPRCVPTRPPRQRGTTPPRSNPWPGPWPRRSATPQTASCVQRPEIRYWKIYQKRPALHDEPPKMHYDLPRAPYHAPPARCSTLPSAGTTPPRSNPWPGPWHRRRACAGRPRSGSRPARGLAGPQVLRRSTGRATTRCSQNWCSPSFTRVYGTVSCGQRRWVH